MFESKLKGLKINWIKTSPQRREFVLKDITAGSSAMIDEKVSPGFAGCRNCNSYCASVS
jgi:hypothetical protein